MRILRSMIMQPMVGLVETLVEELRGTKILVEVGGEFGGYGNYDKNGF